MYIGSVQFYNQHQLHDPFHRCSCNNILLISCVNKLCNVVTAYSRIIDKDQGDSFADQIQVFLISFFSLPGEPTQVFEHDRIAFMKGLLQLDPFAPDEILTGRIITIDPDIIDLVLCGLFLQCCILPGKVLHTTFFFCGDSFISEIVSHDCPFIGVRITNVILIVLSVYKTNRFNVYFDTVIFII